jgi:hypothetical protein
MGWIRTIKSVMQSMKYKLFHIPTTLKKKVIRSKSVRSLLSKQLGRVLTGILEIHILALAGLGLKWASNYAIQCAFSDQRCYDDNYHPINLETACEWTIDILIPTIFALSWHDSFLSLVCWTFERPLISLARRIQYMRPNDPYQFLRIKYIILMPCLMYIGTIVTLFPLSRNFIQICLVQTLIIHVIKDFWPLRHDWIVLPDPVPHKITILDKPPNSPTNHNLDTVDEKESKCEGEGEGKIDWNTVLQGQAQIHTSHFPVATSDPFARVVFT